VQRWAKDAAEVAGRRLEISSHDLRKTAATQLLLRGASIEQVQELLGHASADTTLTCYVTDRRPLAVTTGITSDQPLATKA
jgi:site-specific recombinase XerD